MKRAIISDIHSNLEAFEAVLADIQKENATELFCLGDLVGYGPNPIECIDRMLSLKKEKKVCLMGNHDQATLFDPDGFNSIAEQAIYWTRNKLEQAGGIKKQQRWDFLGELPRSFLEGDALFVHGSPRNPLNEYVFSDDIIDDNKMGKLFSVIEKKYCFQGHTHVPGIFTESKKYFKPTELDNNIYHLTDEKLMVNVGSVGQPRDRDPRACYVIYDSDLQIIEYRRVEYDFDKTCKKIMDIPELDNFLGERIKQGK